MCILYIINPGVIIVSRRGQVVYICTRLGPPPFSLALERLRRRLGAAVSHPRVCAQPLRGKLLCGSHPSQSATVACRVPNRSVRSSRATLAPTQQPRATTHSASKFAVAGMQFFLICAPAFELVIYFPRGRPLLDETLFCVCEVLLVARLRKGIRMLYKSKQ